jgi:hypothetical protein
MIRFGVTGHQSIPDAAERFVLDALRNEIDPETRTRSVRGVSSLAKGADQLFAKLILDAGGDLEIILPALDYEKTFDDAGLRTYLTLIARASRVNRLPYEHATEESFFAAGKRVVEVCDILLAVWDGQPSRGLGGTADVVHYAQKLGRPVTVIWPAGVMR